MADYNDPALHISTEMDTEDVKNGVKDVRSGVKKIESDVKEAGKKLNDALNIDTSQIQKILDDVGKDVTQHFKDFTDQMREALKTYEETFDKIDKAESFEEQKELVEELAAQLEKIKEYGQLDENSLKALQVRLEFLQGVIEGIEEASEEAGEALKEGLTVPDDQDLDGFTNGVGKAVDDLKDSVKKLEKESKNPKFLENLGKALESYAKKYKQAFDKSGFSDLFGNQSGQYKSDPDEDLADDFNEYRDNLRKFAESAREAQKAAEWPKLGDMAESVSKINEAFVGMGWTDNIKGVGSAIERAERELERFAKTTFEIDGKRVLGVDTDEYKAAQSTFDQTSASFIEKAKELGKTTEIEAGRAAAAVTDLKMSFDTITEVNTPDQAMEVLEGLREKLERIKEMHVFADDDEQIIEFQDALDTLTEQVNVAKDAFEAEQAALNDFIDTCAEAGSPEYKGNIEDLTNELLEQREAYSHLENADPAVLQQMSNTIDELTKIIEQNTKAVDENAKKTTTLSAAWDKGTSMWNQMPTLSGMMLDSFTKMTNGAANFIGIMSSLVSHGFEDKLGAIDRAAGAAASQLIKLGTSTVSQGMSMMNDVIKSSLLNLKKMAGDAVIGGFRRLTGAVRGSISAMKQVASNTILGGFRKLTGVITGSNRSMQGLTRGVQMTLGNILQLTLGFRAFNQLFGQVKSALMSGFGKIMESDSGFAETVNNMKQSLETLKMSFAAAFLPIVQIVIPYLTMLINALAKAVSYIGMFIAALTGQSTYKQAVANNDAVAQSANKAADATENAAKAAEEEKKQVESFDELHILDENDQKSNGAAGAGGPAASLQDAPIDSKVKDLADWLKKMWDMADFTELGKRLGESLKKLLDSIPWDKIKEVARKLGKSIATFLNGLMDVPGLFYAIGKALAEALNTIFEFLNSFAENLRWDLLGKAIKDGILGFLDNIDWPLIYSTFAAFGRGIGTALENALDDPELWKGIFTALAHIVEAIFTFLYELVSQPDWGSIARNIGTGFIEGINQIPWDLIYETFREFGKSLGEFIEGLFDNPELWEAVFTSIGHAIEAIFTFLHELLVTPNWESIARSFGDGLIAGFDSIPWGLIYVTLADFGKTVGQLIEGLFDNQELWDKAIIALTNGVTAIFLALYEFVTTPDWGSIATTIGNALNTGVENFPWELVTNTIVAALSAVIDMAYNFLTTFDFMKFGAHIGEAISDIVANTDWDKAAASVAEFCNALYDLANGFLGEIDFYALGEKVVSAIYTFFGEFDWASVGTYISNLLMGLFNFLLGALQGINWIELPDKIIGAIKDFLSGVQWADIATTVWDLFVAAMLAAVQLLVGATDAIGQLGIEIINGLLNGITEGLKNIVTWLGDHVFTPIIDGFRSVFDMHSPSKKMGELGVDLIAGLGQGIIDWITNIPAWLAEHVGGPIIGGIMKLFGIDGGEPALKESGEGTIEGMKNGMVGALSNAFGWVKENIGDKLLGPMKSIFGTENGSSTVTKEYGEEVADGLKDGIKSNAGDMEKVAKDKLVDPVIDPLKSGFGISGNDAKKFSEMGTQMTSSMQTGISKGAGKLKETASNLAKSIISVFKDIKWEDVGRSVIEPITKSVQEGAKKVIEVFKELTNAIVTFFKSVDWGELGHFLIGSIEKSIGEGAKQILDTVKRLCDGIVEFFKSVDWNALGLGIVADIAGAIANGVSVVLDAAKSVANGIIETFQNSDWASAGSNVISSIHATISSGVSTLIDLAGEMANGMLDVFGSYNWEDIGANVINGIWNGIQRGWSSLYNLVWDLAEDMWNAAKRALGIASPSKEFAWIGAMITEGLAGGIDDTQKAAVSSAVELAEAVLDGANGVKPKVSMEPAVDGLDDVLTTFSDKVTSSFSMLVAKLEEIASGSSFYIPGVAAGAVVPYSVRGGDIGGREDVFTQILDKLTTLGYSQLSRADLQEILERVIRDNLNISFYLSDEQIARHANAGNLRIERRYKPVTS